MISGMKVALLKAFSPLPCVIAPSLGRDEARAIPWNDSVSSESSGWEGGGMVLEPGWHVGVLFRFCETCHTSN